MPLYLLDPLANNVLLDVLPSTMYGPSHFGENLCLIAPTTPHTCGPILQTNSPT